MCRWASEGGMTMDEEIEAPTDDLEASEDMEDDALGDAVSKTRRDLPGVEDLVRANAC